MAARRRKGSVRSVLQHRLQDGSLLGAYTGRVKTAAAKNARRIESMLDIAIITKQSCEVMHAVLKGLLLQMNILKLVRNYSQVGICIEVSCNKYHNSIILQFYSIIAIAMYASAWRSGCT